MGGVLSFTPLDFINLLLDLKRLEIVEFGFVTLEFGVELVFTAFLLHLLKDRGRRKRHMMTVSQHDAMNHRGAERTHRLIPLEKDYTTAFVTCGKVVA